jgi:hypothetical protein
MKTIIATRYVCEVCGAAYDTPTGAQACEQRPVRFDSGVQVGDRVRIVSGDGAGQIAVVTKRVVITPTWGDRYAERYAHTRALEAQLVDRGLCRFLTFDAYVPEG